MNENTYGIKSGCFCRNFVAVDFLFCGVAVQFEDHRCFKHMVTIMKLILEETTLAKNHLLAINQIMEKYLIF